MNRREFLFRTGLFAGAATLGGGLLGRLARAAGEKDHYFVFCYFEGGWDHLLGLDPRDPSEFTEAAVRETGIQPGYELLPGRYSRRPIDAGPFLLGPCVGELAALSDHFSVIRGVNMATLTHEVGRRYFLTGRAPSGLTARGSSVATLAASQIGPDRPVPHLSHLVESYNVDQPAYAGALGVAAVDHVQYILREDLGLPTDIPPNVKGALGAYWRKQRSCEHDHGPATSRLGQLYEESRARARAVVTSNLHRHFQFGTDDLAPVRAHYGLDQGIETPAGRAALAAQALKTGLSRVVSVALSTGLDTHDGQWANDHSTGLEAGFNALARLITDLRDTEAPGGGGSLLSKTTIVAFSEFGRTARLNERNGRDHSLTNCALLAGAGIRPRMAIGRSNDLGMGPELVDLETGRPSEAGVSLTPEHVTSTALVAARLDAAELRSQAIGPLLDLL